MQAEREAVKKEEKEFAEFWRVRNEELQAAEQQEKEEEKQRLLELTKFRQRQAEIKNEKAVQEFKDSNQSSLQA